MEETCGGLASILTKDNHHTDTEQVQRTTEFVSVNLCVSVVIVFGKDRRYAAASLFHTLASPLFLTR